MRRSLAAFAFLLILISGCSKVPVDIGLNPDLSKQVTDAVAAIGEFSQVVDRTPENLRAAADKVIDKLKFEGRDFLAHDARYFADHTLGSSGAVAKGIVNYADEKMKAYLAALKTALEDSLPKIKAEKSRDKAIELLKNIKVNVKPLDPFVELVNPNKLTLNHLQTYTGETKGTDYKSPGILELSGFGFLRPADEPTDYHVAVVGAKETRVLPTTIVSQSGPFILLINMSHFTPANGDQKIIVSWGKKKLADIPFETLVLKDSPPPPPPVVPKVVSAWLVSNTGEENKDKKKGYSIYISVHPSGPVVAKTGTISSGEEYPNGLKDKKVDVPIQTAEIDARSTFRLRVETEANLDWDTTFYVVMLVDNGGVKREHRSQVSPTKQFRHKTIGGPESYFEWDFRLEGQ